MSIQEDRPIEEILHNRDWSVHKSIQDMMHHKLSSKVKQVLEILISIMGTSAHNYHGKYRLAGPSFSPVKNKSLSNVTFI